jgi:hypothetical protein
MLIRIVQIIRVKAQQDDLVCPSANIIFRWTSNIHHVHKDTQAMKEADRRYFF